MKGLMSNYVNSIDFHFIEDVFPSSSVCTHTFLYMEGRRNREGRGEMITPLNCKTFVTLNVSHISHSGNIFR